MSASYFDLLKYAATGSASPDMTYYDRMRASTLMGEVVKTLTGIPPLSFKADGNPLISWSMKGNDSQTGTPSPQSIIMPTFCGVRTGNLFDKSATDTNNGYIGDGYLKSDGSKIANAEYRASEYISIKPNKAYMLYYGSKLIIPSVCFYDSAKNFISGIAYGGRWNVPFTTPQSAAFLRLPFRAVDKDAIMLNLGSTALPYEPFGWAEKITCAGQTVPVYLGEVPTVRRIKKLVLTGEEQWQFYSDVSGVWQFYINDISLGGVAQSSCMSNITPYGATATTRQRYDYGCYLVTAGNGVGFQMKGAKDTFTGIASWESYLAAQYAAGHPVTIWYVLAEPQTGIVNEPLAKIGDYADELNSEDAAVTIPTVKGQNTLTVDTPIQPSEMTITYKG